MTDKEKDLKKEPTEESVHNLKVEFKPSGAKTEPFVVKKTPDQIKIENSATVSSSIDINSNLGSFGADTPSPNEATALSTDKVSTLEKIQENSSQVTKEMTDGAKIDFDKFERRKTLKVKTKLGIKLDG